jgi:putative transcriptional regulator
MSLKIDFSVANSKQIEAMLCKRIEDIRLSRNMTQKKLASEAGVSLRTIGRLEKGAGISLDTFIRVLMALDIQQNLKIVLPDPSIRPVDRIGFKGGQRKRARPGPSEKKSSNWSWADGGVENE